MFSLSMPGLYWPSHFPLFFFLTHIILIGIFNTYFFSISIFILLIFFDFYINTRTGDIELQQGERVVMCERTEKDWWKVFHLEKHEELLVHYSIFP